MPIQNCKHKKCIISCWFSVMLFHLSWTPIRSGLHFDNCLVTIFIEHDLWISKFQIYIHFLLLRLSQEIPSPLLCATLVFLWWLLAHCPSWRGQSLVSCLECVLYVYSYSIWSPFPSTMLGLAVPIQFCYRFHTIYHWSSNLPDTVMGKQ
jgi:hypothetical protein